MKPLLYLITASAALCWTGCSEDDTQINRADPVDPVRNMRTVQLRLAGAELETRTAITSPEGEAPKLVWTEGDRISYFVTLDGGEAFSTAASATVSADGSVSVDNLPLDAFGIRVRYPAVKDGTAWSDPAVAAAQTQSAPDRFNGGNLPLVADGDIAADASSADLPIRVLGSVVALRLTVPDGEAVRTVVLSGSANLVKGSKRVTLGITAPAAGEHTYYCVIDPGTHDLGLSVETDAGTYAYEGTLGEAEYGAGIYHHAHVFEKPEPEATPVDGDGKANCYVLSAPGEYSFDASTAGNGLNSDESTAEKLIGADAAEYGAAYLWTTGSEAAAVISEVAYDPESRRITVRVPDPMTPGSVAVALYRLSDKQIVWTWHLWVNATVADNRLGAYNWMNQNLGATSPSVDGAQASYGFYYQFGRKDPEIGANAVGSVAGTVENTAFADKTAPTTVNTALFGSAGWEYHPAGMTLAEAAEHPMRHAAADANSAFAGDVDLKTLWGTGTKTKYDPCPPGYKIPTAAQLTGIITVLKNSTETKNDATNGRQYTITADNVVWMPMPGYRLPTAASITQLGRVTHIWGTGDSANPQTGYTMRCTTPDGTWTRAVLNTLAYGATVRCVRVN